jgi:hypothetical protein
MSLGALVRPRNAGEWRNVILLLLLGDVIWLAAIWLYGRTS